MKYAFATLLLVCCIWLTSCSWITRFDRIACGAPQGVPEAKLLLFGGELGTVEDPAFVGKVVCLRALEGPTALGLEIPTSEQGAIDRYLASNGDASSKAHFLSGNFWQTDKDGRSSAAIFKLIEYARRMQRRGLPLTVFTFAEDKPSMTYSRTVTHSEYMTTLRLGSSPSTTYDAFMARAIREFHVHHPRMRIVALMGAGHASRAPIWIGGGQTIASTDYLLRDLDPMQVLLRNHAGDLQHFLGTDWECLPDFCGSHKVGNIYPWFDKMRPGFYQETYTKGYDTEYMLSSMTASPPEVDAEQQQKASRSGRAEVGGPRLSN